MSKNRKRKRVETIQEKIERLERYKKHWEDCYEYYKEEVLARGPYGIYSLDVAGLPFELVQSIASNYYANELDKLKRKSS